MNFKALWSDLPNEVREIFEKSSTSLNLRRGDIIYREGDLPKGVYFIESGLVGLVKTGVSGKEHLLRFFRQGQFFGHRSLFSNEEYHGSTTCLEATSVRLVPKTQILQSIEKYPALLKDVVVVLAQELRRCENQHVMILENQILSRVALAIVYLKDLHPEHNWTRQEIANFCASTVSTVIKAMGELEENGYISQKGRSIEILDRQALINLHEVG